MFLEKCSPYKQSKRQRHNITGITSYFILWGEIKSFSLVCRSAISAQLDENYKHYLLVSAEIAISSFITH